MKMLYCLFRGLFIDQVFEKVHNILLNLNEYGL